MKKLFVYWLNRVSALQVLLYLNVQLHQKNPIFLRTTIWMTLFDIWVFHYRRLNFLGHAWNNGNYKLTKNYNSELILPKMVVKCFVTMLKDFYKNWMSLRTGDFSVLLHKGNKYPSVQIAHISWKICAHLKVHCSNMNRITKRIYHVY